MEGGRGRGRGRGTQHIIHSLHSLPLTLADSPRAGRSTDISVKEGVVGREGGREAILGNLSKHPLRA